MGNLCASDPARDVVSTSAAATARPVRRVRHEEDTPCLTSSEHWDRSIPPMTRHELQQKRQQFWESRIGGSPHMWQAIQLAVDSMDDAAVVLSSAGLTPFDMDSSEGYFSYDERGYRYDVPMYMFREPRNLITNEATASAAAAAAAVAGPHQETEEEKKLKELSLEYKVRLSTGKDVMVKVQGNDSVAEMKRQIQEATQIPVSCLRPFYLGKPMRDELVMGLLGIPQTSVIQIMIAGR